MEKHSPSAELIRPMRDHLLGYVLGALEPHEQEVVERRLEADPETKRLVQLLERRVSSLECLRETAAPPLDLAARTCDLVAERAAAMVPRREPTVLGGDTRRADRPHVVGLAALADSAAPRGWSVADLLVAASVLLAAGLLFLPAVANSRYQSRLVNCQNNLRQLGVALVSYSDISGGAFPAIPEQGRLSFAGVYSATLCQHELVKEPGLLVCPASLLAREREEFHLVTLDELEAASDDSLARLKERVGGSYAYCLGYVENGVYQTPRNQGRSQYAILSDAPCPSSGRKASAYHGGCGENVLFEDGSVRYLVGCTLGSCGDDIFKNRNGLVAAGLDADDSVLAESSAPPLLNASYRR